MRSRIHAMTRCEDPERLACTACRFRARHDDAIRHVVERQFAVREPEVVLGDPRREGR